MFSFNHAEAQIFLGLWHPVEVIKENPGMIWISGAFARQVINVEFKPNFQN